MMFAHRGKSHRGDMQGTDGDGTLAGVEMQPMAVTRTEESSDAEQQHQQQQQLQDGSGIIYPLDFQGMGGIEDDEDQESFGQPLLPMTEYAKHGDTMNDAHLDPHRMNARGITPSVVPHRWIQLFYLSMLALLSDWICFSLAACPSTFENEAYPGHSSSSLIDMFLFMNVASCFFVTDVVAKFGLKRTVQAASALMTLGCWLRSGLSIVGVLHYVLHWLATKVFFWTNDDDTDTTTTTAILQDSEYFTLVSYPVLVAGTLMVGAAQPFFQCTPPLLSAQWFASDERATSTAVALNFNQIGIATAFLVGGSMGTTSEGLIWYFLLISVACTICCVGTFLQFQALPPVPPSTSELEKLIKGETEPPFLVSAKKFFKTPGFARPLAAFICSIAITNIVGAFIDEVMARGGITKRSSVALAGSGFEMAILLGGIILGGYVDKTKAYKSVTLMCIALSVVFVIPLGLTEHALGANPTLIVVSLLGLGFFTGPIQPINAELAVDVTYPGDETAVESVQQIGGNLVSAILVPLAERAAREDYELLPDIPILASDIRGDVILLMFVAIVTYIFFNGFDAPLRRTRADREDK
eukprot:CAMPEP_0195280646 /NCGR_PEP_ID=MMETSP0707-20130614/249_1 /TAXON_ID=33640 /ORGANISM="Asterionellopsis glacialis, Strain CCMP134" /LENGTH=582 /DNA_ID=CAMNT_0040339425 /DNA_START=306 /DNA_END=2054 /DNA_ORIENTATION=-